MLIEQQYSAFTPWEDHQTWSGFVSFSVYMGPQERLSSYLANGSERACVGHRERALALRHLPLSHM